MSRRALLIVAGVVALFFFVLVAALAVGVFAGYQSETRAVQEPTIIWQKCGGRGMPPCPPSLPRARDVAR
jgi:hypothetical protein